MPKGRMSPRKLLRHVAKHENEYVCEYVDAILDERAELRRRIAQVSRVGYTEAARTTVRRTAMALGVFVMVAAAYLIGAAGH